MCRNSGSAGEPGQRGQILILAIVLLAAGMLMLTPLVSQLATMFQKGGDEREQRMKVYAAEAAINRVMADLIRGADGVATTYTTTSSHRPGDPYQTFNIPTSYSSPSVTVNSYTPTLTISLPTLTQAKPASQQNYVDPGIVHPNLAMVGPRNGYLMRLYNVKAGTVQVNWAYSPAAPTRITIWAGMPVDPLNNQPFPPGLLDQSALDRLALVQQPIVQSDSGPTAANNLTPAITVNPATDQSGGVYTFVFENKSGSQTLTTAAFSASGGTANTWIYAKAYKDYIITADVGGVSVTAYVRQVPGFSEPPAYTTPWSIGNVSFITNEVYPYTWLSP